MFLRVISAMVGSLLERVGHQPLTAPAVSPATIRRWNTNTRMMIGIVTTMAPAAIAVVGCWNCEAPVKNASAAGTVRDRVVEVSVMANAKSCHAAKKAMMAVVKTPGAASGPIALVNACQGVAPSTCAACSISQGISRKNADSTQIESGNVNETYGMMRPGQVS